MKKAVLSLLLVAVVCTQASPVQVSPKKLHNGLKHQIRPRIAFGQSAKPGEFPYMVFLSDEDGFLHGGGVLISNEYILTTADNMESYDSVHDIVVRLGEYNWEDDDEKTVSRYIHHSVQHPEFDSATLQNNIGLLHMHPPVNFTNIVKAACVNKQESKQLIGQKAVVTGWGLNEDFQMSEVLQKHEAEVISLDDCKQQYTKADYDGHITDTDLCAKTDKGGACSGDQGGPLIIQQNGANRLIGIVSWILSCDEHNLPGIYVDVAKYEGWLRQATNDAIPFCS